MRYGLAVVRWLDSTVVDAFDGALEPLELVSVGFLLERTPTKVVLCMERAEDPDYDAARHGLCIPAGCVLEVQELEVEVGVP